MSAKPTIKEIAKLANVSIGTVDRVIHNRGEVSSLTKQRIESIMIDLDYVPNAHARNLALNKIIQIAVLLPKHKKGEYWDFHLNGINEAEKDFKPLGVRTKIYYYNQFDSQSFTDACKKVLKERNEAVLLTELLQEPTKIFLKQCDEIRLPYAIFGSNVNGANTITNISQNAYQSGRLAAELLNYRQEKSPFFLIVNISNIVNKNVNVDERIRGFKAYIKENKSINGSYEILEAAINDSNLEQKLVEKLGSIPKLDGVFVPNSKSYIVAKSIPKHKKFRIVGYDLLDKNQQLLKNGKIDFLINQRPYEQTYQGVEYLYRYIGMGQNPPSKVEMPLDIVTKENLMYF